MRDFERQNRFGTSFSVSFPDFPSITKPARNISIIQGRGKHEIVELYYYSFNRSFFKAIKTGVPVSITWKTDKSSGKFVGYTTDVSYINAQQLNRDVKITCVGSSFPLKERSSKIWISKTASEVVEEIAKKFKLKPFVTKSNVRFSQISMVGHSYWEKINELAHRIGYGVQVIETELHFHPIDKMIDQFMTSIPTLSFQDPLQHPESALYSHTLQYFEPVIGDHIEAGDYSRSTNTVSGVDPITGKPIKGNTSSNKVGKGLRSTTKDPLFSSVETRTVVASAAMGKALSEARAQHGRFSMSAKGIAQGDPRIAPWRTIEIKGTGDTTDGFWVVDTTEHVMYIDGRYNVEFTCVADGTGPNKTSVTRPSSAGSVPKRNVIQEMTTNNQRKPTSTKLVAPATMVKQTNAGYKVTPRRWKGD